MENKCSCGKRLKIKCVKESNLGGKMCLKEDAVDNFKREERYMVIKLNKLSDEICSDGLTREEIIWRAADFGKALVKCAVVEADWPIYGDVWKMIEKMSNEQI